MDTKFNYINVLSLFDGISCGRLALQRAGVNVRSYWASEIDKNAIAVSKSNWDDVLQIGDVSLLDASYFNLMPKIDLLIGGSPCQGFSLIGKLLNFEDPRSKLFFEYVRILGLLRQRNPGIKFMLENVKMKKEHQDIITAHLGVTPVEINSGTHTPQKRKRLYWCNFALPVIPEEPHTLGECILPGSVTPELYLNDTELERAIRKHAGGTWHTGSKNGKVAFPTPLTRPSKCLIATVIKAGRDSNHIQDENGIRLLSVNEWELLQGLPIGYCRAISKSKTYHAIGNAWQVDTITRIFKNLYK